MNKIGLVVLTILLCSTFIPLTHALYIVPLPSNVLFADDFNEFTSGTDFRQGTDTSATNGCPASPGSHLCVGKSGWSWYDNAAGGYVHASNNNSYSPTVSMEMASSTALSPNGKFDIHHLVPTTNTTSLVTLSAYFAFDNFTRNGAGGNNAMTFSIETWDYGFKYECVLFVTPAAATVNIVSDDSLANGGNINLRIAAYDDTRMVYDNGNWHHVKITCDIQKFQYVSVI